MVKKWGFYNENVRQILLAACLVLFASTSSAVHNLKQPAGLAVDSAGNLYVANYGLNETSSTGITLEFEFTDG
jgi:hypothetical protein